MENENDDFSQSNTSGGSIDMKETIGAPAPLRVSPQSQNSGNSSATAKHGHRRTYSEDLHMNRTAYYPVPYPGQMNPPPQFVPSPLSRGSLSSQSRRISQVGNRRMSHHRSNSWNAPPPIGGLHGLSSSGNPLIPVLQDGGIPTESFVYGTTSGNSRRKRSYSGSSTSPHRLSSPSPTKFRTGVEDFPPPPPPLGTGSLTSGVSPSHRSDFSPRSEIMNFTKGFNSRRSGLTPPASPVHMNGASNLARMSPRVSPQQPVMRPTYGITSPHGDKSKNIPSQPHQENLYSSQNLFRGVSSWQYDSGNGIPSEKDPLLRGEISANGGISGGEAVFEAKKRNKRRHSQSSRKMHMRQHSAQLFMEDVKGTHQKHSCRDILFLLLFLFHFVGMGFLGKIYGQEAIYINPDTPLEEIIEVQPMNVIFLACICGVFAVVVSFGMLILMIAITEKIVQLALILTIAMSFAWGTIGIGLSPKNFVPVTGIIALALSVAYAFVVWDRIPFASSNLHAGLSALKENAGAVLVALFFQFLTLVWTIYYVFVLIGVYDALQIGDLVLSTNMKIFVYTMLGISYYWTFHVLMNVVQVTVAGTIGRWWFQSGQMKVGVMWNENISQSLFSTLFYSIGSVCFGSLLIGPVRVIRQLSALFRPSSDEVSILMCLHECVHCLQSCFSNCVDNLSDHFNPWAFTYVGLYGYSLLDAGHNATQLFEKRGWTTIVSDDLVTNVLLMFSIVLGGITGCFAMLIQNVELWGLSNFHTPAVTAFLIGLGIGLSLSSMLFVIISSSVNAIIVCFAGSPVEFERNHFELWTEMRKAWREVWPGCMEVLDLHVGQISPATPHVLQQSIAMQQSTAML
eukprot:CAMPEP_0194133236 /NCGR_PEP_ID=MMETSP0152-20130528/3491_1 /TAXON_ID=1049557 /ORGANISM="Thalassiothrix antarctica, Strain L6-D1" /LENGTH=849 /DNA_ID=CAMNT_0038828513 /DNA_START=64 /DNA_END=2613 /DNA_ORIENTATION=+